MDTKKRILIVEDEPLVLRALKEALTANGSFDILEADNGEKALNIVEEFHPDLILLDINIPKIDGLTLAKNIADKKLNKQTKTIFLTNRGDLRSISDGTETEGVLGYFMKSDWDIKDVVAEIDKKLKEQDAEKARREAHEKLVKQEAEMKAKT